MDALIKEFRVAYVSEQGNDLARTITPDLTASPEKLLAIWKSGGSQTIKEDLRFLFTRDKSAQLRMSREEAEGWQEIYFYYWKALGELLAVEGRRTDGAKVRLSLPRCGSRPSTCHVPCLPPRRCTYMLQPFISMRLPCTPESNSLTVVLDQGIRGLEGAYIPNYPGLHKLRL
jgi:hypothetical protein